MAARARLAGRNVRRAPAARLAAVALQASWRASAATRPVHKCAWRPRVVTRPLPLASCVAPASPADTWAPCVTNATGTQINDLPPNVAGSFIMGLLASSDVLAKHLGHTLAAEAPLAALPRQSSLQVRARGKGAAPRRQPGRPARPRRATPAAGRRGLPREAEESRPPPSTAPPLPPHSHPPPPTPDPLQAHTPFQVGLRTGFCGSLTTFSSWILQVVVMMVGGGPSGRSLWPEGLAALALNVLACLSALVAGQHTCLMLYHW